MVHPGEGRGKISSLHPIKSFREKNTLRRYDPDWIIILFFIHLGSFRVENLEE